MQILFVRLLKPLMPLLLLAGAAVVSPVSHAQSSPASVHYAIDLTNNEHHLAQVENRFPASDLTHLEVKMPVWRAGLYRILDLPNAVRSVRAVSASGRELPVEKLDKATWRIADLNGEAVTFSYELYLNQLGRRARHLDNTHAYLNPSAVFVYADQWRAEPLQVSLQVPAEWRSVSGMEKHAEHAFVAPNWDVFIDSPIETGIHDYYQFEEQGREYEVVFWGHGNYDAEQTVADLRKLVQTGSVIWSDYPFERYVFIMHATDGAGGATEHLNSTVIQRPRYRFGSRDDYVSFIATAAHEFVHTWNVKAYRPAGLVPYDYQQENYSDLLWLAEGSTSYFEAHLLLAADIISYAEYFKMLSRTANTHLNKPGAGVMSIAEASFDAWIAEGGARAHNASVNIYGEGELTSLWLDIALLEASNGEVNYRDVHEALYQKFDAFTQGFTAADVQQILTELTADYGAQDWQAWWQQYIETPHQIDVEQALAVVGLEFTPREETEVWVGWSTTSATDGVQLTRVDRNSPAWDAGFTEGDFIVAINGKRVTQARLQEQLQELATADQVTVSYFRHDVLAQKPLKLAERPSEPVQIRPIAAPTATQQLRFLQWLGVPHPSMVAE